MLVVFAFIFCLSSLRFWQISAAINKHSRRRITELTVNVISVLCADCIMFCVNGQNVNHFTEQKLVICMCIIY